MSKQEEEIRKSIVELQILEKTLESLQARIGLVNASINELHMANATLDGLKKEKKGLTILVPIGGSSYLKAKVDDPETLITGIGANVASEKTVVKVQESLKTRILDLEKVANNLQQHLNQTISRLDAVKNRVQEMTQKASEGKK